MFLTKDKEMSYMQNSDSRYADKNIKFSCRSTSLNEDLGQIKFVLSDKTGRITDTYIY